MSMNDDLRKQMVFEASRKSVGVAYLLWFFLGIFGAHRFYSGRTGTGIAQLVLTISVIGWLVMIPWLIVDIFLIPGMVREENMKTIGALTYGDPQGPIPAQPKPESKPQTEAERRREAMLEDLRSTGYAKKDTAARLYR